jgi:Domain of unknown function (DUF4350)
VPRDPRVRFGLGVVAALVAFGIVLAVVDRLAPQPKGPKSSSYATAPAGLAAYAAVLERNGHAVRRLRQAIADKPPRAGETLIVLDPQALEPKETRAIGRWVKSGGRLVAGGAGDASWLEAVLDAPPEFATSNALDRETLVPVRETVGVSKVRTSGGAWDKVGRALPVIGPPNAPLVVTATTGKGSVALIADASPLSNAGLDRADNAALGLALVGPGKPVAFLETVHGYGVSRGFGGLPGNVKWALLGLALTALVAVWAAGRRFGPPEDPDTEPPPPRMAYVDALAAALVRAKPDNDKERSS